MTDERDPPSLSRRKILGGMGTIGAGAAVSGMGTAALFSDSEEMNDTVVTAGRLDLEVGWERTYYGDEVYEASEELTSDPDPVFAIPPHGDVKPCDHGEATITLHVYDNPAWIHMGGELSGGTGTDLADEIIARVWYDLDGDSVYDDGTEPLITSGSLRDVLEDLQSGIPLDAEPTNGGSENGDRVELGKRDYDGDEPAVGQELFGGAVTITGVHREDGEVVGIDWESDVDICQVDVKGGPPTAEHVYDCARSGTAFAPEREDHRRRNRYEISNVTFYECTDKGKDTAECFENSNDYHIGFEWELPCSVGNDVQNESVEFDLLFHAQQCRHNDDPDNPYA